LGRRAESEAVYASLIQQFPNKGWACIGWSDAYYLWHNSPKEYERAEAILKQALARRDLHDQLDVLDRLCELYADWRQPAKLAKAEEQLEQAAQEAQGAHIDLGQPVRVEPVSLSRTAPSKPLGRNELC
jgi:hypothetical protein